MLLGHPNNLQLALGAGHCTKRVVNGLKNQEKIGEARGMPSMPIVPTQVTLRGNVGSLDAPKASQLFTFGPRVQAIALRGS